MASFGRTVAAGEAAARRAAEAAEAAAARRAAAEAASRRAAAAEGAAAEGPAARRAAASHRAAAAEGAAAEGPAARRAAAEGSAARAALRAVASKGASARLAASGLAAEGIAVGEFAARAARAPRGIRPARLDYNPVASKLNPVSRLGTRLPPTGARGLSPYKGNNLIRDLKRLREKHNFLQKNIRNGKIPSDKALDILEELSILMARYPHSETLKTMKRHLEGQSTRAFRTSHANKELYNKFLAYQAALEGAETVAQRQFAYPIRSLRDAYAYATNQLKAILENAGIAVDNALQEIEHCFEINRALGIDLKLGVPPRDIYLFIVRALNSINNLLPITREMHVFKTQVLEFIRKHPGTDPILTFERIVRNPANRALLRRYLGEAIPKLEALKRVFEDALRNQFRNNRHIEEYLIKIEEDIRLFRLLVSHTGGVIKIQSGGVTNEISNDIADFILDILEFDNNNNNRNADINYDTYRTIMTELHGIQELSEREFDNLHGGSRKNKTLNRKKKMVKKTRKLGGGPFNRAGMMVGKQLMTKAAQGALKSQPLAQTAFKMAPMAFGTQIGNPALKQIPASFGKFVGQSAFPTAINAKKAGFDWHEPSNDEILNSEEYKTVSNEVHGEQWHKNNPEESLKILRNVYGHEEYNDLFAKKVKEKKMEILKKKLDENESDKKKFSQFMQGYAWNKITNVEKNERLLAEEALKGLKKISAPSKKAIELAGMVYGGSLKYKKHHTKNRTRKFKKRSN
jgi:hypothetical protein